ncbi:hypothetical protein [Paraburkholderia ferrariae]|uniref:hypothetical protein n=1 Tax=Paraburkholderia ferrariae TaxID=386056 RepID=UPI0012EC64FC|nr:hypothetical protein [Paraburkholderia ferrariae]
MNVGDRLASRIEAMRKKGDVKIAGSVTGIAMGRSRDPVQLTAITAVLAPSEGRQADFNFGSKRNGLHRETCNFTGSV